MWSVFVRILNDLKDRCDINCVFVGLIYNLSECSFKMERYVSIALLIKWSNVRQCKMDGRRSFYHDYHCRNACASQKRHECCPFLTLFSWHSWMRGKIPPNKLTKATDKPIETADDMLTNVRVLHSDSLNCIQSPLKNGHVPYLEN